MSGNLGGDELAASTKQEKKSVVCPLCQHHFYSVSKFLKASKYITVHSTCWNPVTAIDHNWLWECPSGASASDLKQVPLLGSLVFLKPASEHQ